MNPSSIESRVGGYGNGQASGRWFRIILPVCAFVGSLAAYGEEWFKVYDQTSRVGGEEPAWGITADSFILSTNRPFGQSFTPAFSGIDFVELYFGTSRGASETDTQAIALRLREGTINGPVLSSTAPMFLTWSQPGTRYMVEFTFPNRIELVPGNSYVFEIAHVDGATNLLRVTAECPHVGGGSYYPGGDMIWQGMIQPGWDVWFREGILVPEPGTAVLMALGGLGLWAALRPARRSLGAGGCRAPPP